MRRGAMFGSRQVGSVVKVRGRRFRDLGEARKGEPWGEGYLADGL